MKLLVATRADTNIEGYTKFTHPLMKKFAEDWGADFHVFSSESPCSKGDGRYHYRLVQMYSLLEEYDRIVELDSDILINKNCPNLFDVVPEDKIGTIYEDKGSRRGARHGSIRDAQKRFGKIGWSEGYINTGVFVVSKQHKDIFLPVNGKYWEGIGWDDVHFGYQIKKLKIPVYELPYIFNHMTMFSEGWNGSPDRFKSFIIHYAGAGVFDKKPKIAQMIKDYKQVYGDEEWLKQLEI
jgi:lipopolysaccharide biosynthesis glycosyltransferase